MRHLIFQNGSYVDVESIPHVPFTGVVPRDLEAGDTFETLNENEIVLMQVIGKNENTDGSTSIRSERL